MAVENHLKRVSSITEVNAGHLAIAGCLVNMKKEIQIGHADFIQQKSLAWILICTLYRLHCKKMTISGRTKTAIAATTR